MVLSALHKVLDPLGRAVVWLAPGVAVSQRLGHYLLALGDAVGVVLENDCLGLPVGCELDGVNVGHSRPVDLAVGAELSEDERGAVYRALVYAWKWPIIDLDAPK